MGRNQGDGQADRDRVGLELAAGGGVVGALWLLGLRLQVRAGRRRRERRMEEELAAYARLDLRLSGRWGRARTGEAGESAGGGEERVFAGRRCWFGMRRDG